MDPNNIPVGFRFALTQNPNSMKNFANLPEAQKHQILQKARTVSSKNEMQALVNSISAHG